MKIAIIGGSGFVGSNLSKFLLEKRPHDQIIAIGRNINSLDLSSARLEKKEIDVFDEDKLRQTLVGVDVIYYLIHMMAQSKIDFAVAEDRVAHIVGGIAKENKIPKIIFLGGLGRDEDNLSKHLKSRHHSGDVLRSYVPCVIEFRASMVIGNGSISYDIIKNLVHKLPILTIPRWSQTLTQPIGLSDVLNYLSAAIKLPLKHEIIEIGGPEQLSYRDLMSRYAKFRHKKVILIYLPIIPIGVSSWWLNLFTPKGEAKVGRSLVESLVNRMTVNTERASQLFPDIHPKPLEDVFI